MLTEIATATGSLLQLIDDLLRRTQSNRIDTATSAATADVAAFKDDLLAGRLDAVNLRLAGLQHGILVRLTDSESQQLHAIGPNLDGYALLGLYARARAADLAADCGQIIQQAQATGVTT